MLEILECKPLSEATPEELEELKRNGWKPKAEPKKQTPFQRTEAKIRATGNRWAIENFVATHY